jgi:hypothetical protein
MGFSQSSMWCLRSWTIASQWVIYWHVLCFSVTSSQAMNMFPCCVMVRHGKLLPHPQSEHPNLQRWLDSKTCLSAFNEKRSKTTSLRDDENVIVILPYS